MAAWEATSGQDVVQARGIEYPVDAGATASVQNGFPGARVVIDIPRAAFYSSRVVTAL
jgi:hypothetical protein